MGAKKVNEFDNIQDNAGFYLFGPQNYIASQDSLLANTHGDFNLYVLAEILHESFPFFHKNVQDLHGLYDTVMQHADPLEKSRREHRELDCLAEDRLDLKLRSSHVESALAQELRNSGYGRFTAWWRARRGLVPRAVMQAYVSRDLQYSHLAGQSRNILRGQLDRLESVGEEMDAFKKLLREEIRNTLHSIKARNEVQMAFGGENGYRRARELPCYVNTALHMIPPFCQRRDRLRKRLADERYENVYLKDDLSRLSLQMS